MENAWTKNCRLCKRYAKFPNFVNLQLVDQKRLQLWAKHNIFQKITFPSFACWTCIRDAIYLNENIEKDNSQAWWTDLHDPKEYDVDSIEEEDSVSDSSEPIEEILEKNRWPQMKENAVVKILKLTKDEISAICGHQFKRNRSVQIQCIKCDRKYQPYSLYVKHLRSAHQEVIVCDYCHTFFTHKSVFDIHQELCNKYKWNVQCQECDTCCASENSLQIHVMMKHRPVNCRLCNEPVGNKLNLHWHLKHKHGIKKQD